MAGFCPAPAGFLSAAGVTGPTTFRPGVIPGARTGSSSELKEAVDELELELDELDDTERLFGVDERDLRLRFGLRLNTGIDIRALHLNEGFILRGFDVFLKIFL